MGLEAMRELEGDESQEAQELVEQAQGGPLILEKRLACFENRRDISLDPASIPNIEEFPEGLDRRFGGPIVPQQGQSESDEPVDQPAGYDMVLDPVRCDGGGADDGAEGPVGDARCPPHCI